MLPPYLFHFFKSSFYFQIEHWDQPLVIPLEILKKLSVLNKNEGGCALERHGGFKVPYNAFYVSELSETVDIRVDYVKWVLDNPKVKPGFSVGSHFLFVQNQPKLEKPNSYSLIPLTT